MSVTRDHCCSIAYLESWGFPFFFFFFLSFMAQSTLKVMSSLYTILGRLPMRLTNTKCSNWQLPYLNQQKGENGHRNYFMTKSLWKICGQTEDRARDLLNTSWMSHPTDLAGLAWKLRQQNIIHVIATNEGAFPAIGKLHDGEILEISVIITEPNQRNIGPVSLTWVLKRG